MLIENLTRYVKAKVGDEYVDSVDFMKAAYRAAGVELNCDNLVSLKNSDNFERVKCTEVSEGIGLQDGDLILYKYGEKLFHVAVYANGNIYHPLNHEVGIRRDDTNFLSRSVDSVLRYKPKHAKKTLSATATASKDTNPTKHTIEDKNAVQGDSEPNGTCESCKVHFLKKS